MVIICKQKSDFICLNVNYLPLKMQIKSLNNLIISTNRVISPRKNV